ncbi:3-epi-6-deoxocathasterone 23-monooxygenase CYP90C1 [Citrus sinensis]|uniref:3-epi-6-deoxocathasterone 23-monooxygenase CYP90C1 n=1 Tax=Citrus sinensis TaxID=2711 RepID=A0ACB8J0Z4_CITSI|nr:3-epi-6-deoxocathasterone 23-monooxygenase CYP90C1 [Citrus sinensis]
MSVGPGEDLNFLKKEFEEFLKGLICLPIKFPGTRLYKSLKAKERLLKMVRKIVEERKLTMEEISDEKGVAKDAVDVLLRDNGEANEKQSLSLDFISSNIIEMMIPGEETVPMAMTLAVKFLTDSPVALKQLTFESQGSRICWENLCLPTRVGTSSLGCGTGLKVINETLRMANIINGVWRKALKDVEIKGHLIPKGWCVLTSFLSVHMDEENYDNPYQFDPWRWEKMGAAINNNIFTPFGGGQRLCPGFELSRLEISIFLHHLVTTYE